MPIAELGPRRSASTHRVLRFAYPSIGLARNAGSALTVLPDRGNPKPPRPGPPQQLRRDLADKKWVRQVAPLIGVDESIRVALKLGDVPQRKRQCTQRGVIATRGNG